MQIGWILVNIVGEVEKMLGEVEKILGVVQRSSSQPAWKFRAYCRTGQYQRGEVCM